MVTIEDGMQHLEEIAKRYGDGGRIYIAFVEGKAAGCIAFHPMADRRDCEFKRLFTRAEDETTCE